MKKLLIVMLFFSATSFADVPSEITSALKIFSPLNVQGKQNMIQVTLNEQRVTNTIYETVVNSICTPLWLGKKGYFQSISEIFVLNKFTKQGYVFEHPEETCLQMGNATTQNAKIILMGNTRMR